MSDRIMKNYDLKVNQNVNLDDLYPNFLSNSSYGSQPEGTTLVSLGNDEEHTLYNCLTPADLVVSQRITDVATAIEKSKGMQGDYEMLLLEFIFMNHLYKLRKPLHIRINSVLQDRKDKDFFIIRNLFSRNEIKYLMFALVINMKQAKDHLLLYRSRQESLESIDDPNFDSVGSIILRLEYLIDDLSSVYSKLRDRLAYPDMFIYFDGRYPFQPQLIANYYMPQMKNLPIDENFNFPNVRKALNAA